MGTCASAEIVSTHRFSSIRDARYAFDGAKVSLTKPPGPIGSPAQLGNLLVVSISPSVAQWGSFLSNVLVAVTDVKDVPRAAAATIARDDAPDWFTVYDELACALGDKQTQARVDVPFSAIAARLGYDVVTAEARVLRYAGCKRFVRVTADAKVRSSRGDGVSRESAWARARRLSQVERARASQVRAINVEFSTSATESRARNKAVMLSSHAAASIAARHAIDFESAAYCSVSTDADSVDESDGDAKSTVAEGGDEDDGDDDLSLGGGGDASDIPLPSDDTSGG